MLVRLDHVNLRTARVGVVADFYTRVLGLRVGPRPAFSFGGLWLYCGEVPVVHLVEVDDVEWAASGPSRLEHFAFRAQGLAEFLDRLREHSVDARFGFVRDFGLCQVNVRDPDGTHLHVDFDLAEAQALGLDLG